jgi:plasmid replication initiation protein
MAQAGYGGSMKISGAAVDVEEWTLAGERSIIDATPLTSTYKAVVSGRIAHTGTAVLQWASATKTALSTYFGGVTPTQSTVAFELIVNATEKFTFNALISGYDHAQAKDDLVRVTVRFVVSGQMTVT